MTNLPKVSILIPTFNQEDCVSSAILSALAQSYPNLEVIVVDDASPDRTAEKVGVFNDSRLRYVRNEKNLGRVRNYRRALYELATGEWAVVLDGDDFYIDNHFISKAIALAYSQPGILIVSARHKVVTRTRTSESLGLGEMVITGKEALLSYHDHRYHFSHLGTVYHRPSALANDFYRVDVISSDWESLLRLALNGKVAYLDCVVGCWNLHETNASLSNCWKDLVENLKIWESIYQTSNAIGVPRHTLLLARNANLLSVAFRDLHSIFKGGTVFGGFNYLFHGYPIFKTTVALKIIIHPYIWIKFGINIFNVFFPRKA